MYDVILTFLYVCGVWITVFGGTSLIFFLDLIKDSSAKVFFLYGRSFVWTEQLFVVTLLFFMASSYYFFLFNAYALQDRKSGVGVI
jgi:hypothetical protein